MSTLARTLRSLVIKIGKGKGKGKHLAGHIPAVRTPRRFHSGSEFGLACNSNHLSNHTRWLCPLGTSAAGRLLRPSRVCSTISALSLVAGRLMFLGRKGHVPLESRTIQMLVASSFSIPRLRIMWSASVFTWYPRSSPPLESSRFSGPQLHTYLRLAPIPSKKCRLLLTICQKAHPWVLWGIGMHW